VAFCLVLIVSPFWSLPAADVETSFPFRLPFFITADYRKRESRIFPVFLFFLRLRRLFFRFFRFTRLKGLTAA